MANGRPRRIEAVAFDAMFTIVQPKGTRAELNARVLKSVAGITADPATLDELIRGFRRARPRERSLRMEDYWPQINAQLLERLAPGKLDPRQAKRLGREMHKRTLNDTSLYEVRPDMRDLLMWLREQVTVAVASNQKHRALIEHLRAHGLDRFFGPHVYSSGRIGSPKPSRHFWKAVLRGVGASAYGSLAYVGNSVENDIELALNDRAPVALFDPNRVIPGLAVAGVSMVHDEIELRTWLEEILHRHKEEEDAPTVPPEAIARTS